MFINAEWFARLLASAFKAGIHMTWITDSTGTAGGSTGFCTYYIAAPSEWRPPCSWGGMQLPDLAGTALGNRATNQVDVTNAAGYDYMFPGFATPEGNTDGRSVGAMYKWPFTANRATDGRLRLATALDNDWCGIDATWVRRALKARVYGLKTPTGPTEMRLYGVRNGVRGTATLVDMSTASTGGVDETLVSIEADIAAGAGNPAVEICAGAGDETSKDAIFGMPFIYDPRGIGLIMDTIGMGGAGVPAFSDTAGMAISSPSYTHKICDATLEQYFQQSKITGTRRVILIHLGQNDAALNEAAWLAKLRDLITRVRARFDAIGEPQPAFILRSPPDPGPVVDSRFDGFDRSVKTVAESMTTPASPIMAVQSRAMMGTNQTLSSSFGGTLALADTVHPTVAGARAYERLFWRAFMERVYKPMFSRGGAGGRR